jgi:hypothetical protein
MKSKLLMFLATIPLAAQAQSQFEAELCEAATNNRTIEMVYDKDASKGCEPRLIDVHQVAIGNNGSLYMHGCNFEVAPKGVILRLNASLSLKRSNRSN